MISGKEPRMSGTCAAVFVYGTLRPGQPNHSAVARGVAAAAAGHGHGLQLYRASHWSFPYAGPGHDCDVVVGTVLTLRPDRRLSTLRRLDDLEGFDPEHPDRGHYLRRLQTVAVDEPGPLGPVGTIISAWVYLAGPRTRLDSLHRIPSGDWLHQSRRPERTQPCAACSA